MELTRSNIAYDLNISPHSCLVVYENYEIRYVFSSDLYRRKFLSKIEDNRKKINQSLSIRFGFSVDVESLADLKLYTSIEKRGFLIFKSGEKIDCLNDIELNGLILTTKS